MGVVKAKRGRNTFKGTREGMRLVARHLTMS